MLMNRLLGSILLIAGTAIGAGMLALPVTTAPAGFLPTTVVFVIIWIMMIASALLLLEVNLSLRQSRDLLSMAQTTLGQPGLWITWFVFLFLLYALNAAYITGGAQWLDVILMQVPMINHTTVINTHHQNFSAVLFTLILAVVIYLGTHAVVSVNRLFMLLLAISFIGIESIGLASSTSHVVIHKNMWAILPAVPVIMTSFGFHVVIPTLTEYLAYDRTKLKKAIVIGSTIPLFVYILWIATVFSWLPPEAIQSMESAEDKLGSFILLTTQYGSTPYLATFLKTFALAVLLTSFLGVAMSLFHFLEDGLHHKVSHPIIVTLITFLPPLFFAIQFPEGFVFALGFAGIFVALLLGILPCLMVWRLRYHLKASRSITLPGGRLVLLLLIILFTAVIAIEAYYVHLPYLAQIFN